MRGATVEVKCKNSRCGAMFTARVADRKRGWGKFCSKSCKAAKQSQSSANYSHVRGDNEEYEAAHESGLEALHEDYMADCGQR